MKNGTAVVVANKPLTEFDDHHILMNECEIFLTTNTFS